jgi:hypothetical protein
MWKTSMSSARIETCTALTGNLLENGATGDRPGGSGWWSGIVVTAGIHPSGTLLFR